MHSQAALRGPDLHNSATTPALHIIAMSTPQLQRNMLLFWLRMMPRLRTDPIGCI